MYFLDLLGTFAFAITGAYKAKQAHLHFFGVIFLAVITAIGGGTIRDLIIGRVPLFYLKDPDYLLICVIGALATFIMPAFFNKRYSFFRFIDTIGLAAFCVIGVSVSYKFLFPEGGSSLLSFLSCVFLGMLTGFGGGVVRDAIMGDTPLSLKKESNYATSAFLGAFIFYALMFINIRLAAAAAFALVLVMREIISKYGIYKKIII